MSRLLIVADSPLLSTGLGRVVRELAPRFKTAGHEVAVAGWFHTIGQSQQRQRPAQLLYPVVDVEKQAPQSILPLLNTYQPEVVLAIGDPWDFEYLASVRAQYPGKFMLAGYLTIEAAPVTPKMEQVLDAFDVILTASDFGARTIARPGVQAVHYGVDRTVFYPTQPQAELMGRDLTKTFVVLLNAQNTQRKNLASALDAFAIFARGKTDVICFANTLPMPREFDAPGLNLADVIAQHDLGDLVTFNSSYRGPWDCCSDEQMNMVYGCSTVLLVTSHAEGFCLPVLEAMSTLTVPVAPASYSMPELIGVGSDRRGELIPVRGSFKSSQGTDYVTVDPAESAQALETVYAVWKAGQMSRYHRSGVRFAVSHSWDRTFEDVADALQRPRRQRVAQGLQIDPYLRARGRREVAAAPAGAIGVLKLGGLGDMLQTTAVIRAAWNKYRRPVIVFTTGHEEVFEQLPEVVKVVTIKEQLQDVVARSLVDLFDVFLDVRYVSRAIGQPPTAFFLKHVWFYENWAHSNCRLSDLGMHTTRVMLESLGLTGTSTGIAPIFTPREGGRAMETGYLCVASGVGSLGLLKQPPVEWWEELSALLDDRGFYLVQVGGEDDMPVTSSMDCRGGSLARTASILQHADGFLGVEGGMAHLAVAVGQRPLVLFGPTSPVLFAYPETRVLDTHQCAPCWWGPAWGRQVCTRGEPSCVNIPEPAVALEAVLKSMQPAKHEAVG